MSASGSLRRLPLMVAQYRWATTGAQGAATARLISTGATDQHGDGSSRQRIITAAAMALLGAGAVASASGRLDAAADAPTPIEVASDPYAGPAEARPLPSSITLYQYEVCPYCCKVRALLDYYKLPYTVIEVNPLTKGELKWSTYKKVPVVQLDEEVVVDSSAIISRLATDVAAARPQVAAPAAPAAATPAAVATSTSKPAEAPVKRGFWASLFGGSSSTSSSAGSDVGSGEKDQAAAEAVAAPAAAPVAAAGPSAEELAEEVRWRKWVDERMVKVLTANIYRNWDESVETFKYITEQTRWGWGTRELARWTGAVIMWRVGKGMPAKYGIEGDLRTALYDTANDFVDNALRGRRFAGGDRPNLADVSAFGVIRAVRLTGAFRDLMENSRLGPWYQAMEAEVGPSSRLEK